jgi:hypothetical protein
MLLFLARVARTDLDRLVMAFCPNRELSLATSRVLAR